MIHEILRALEFASARHEQAGNRYGEHPYKFHLLAVLSVAFEFSIADPVILVACPLHDTIEDTPTTREELAVEFGSRVAELVWRVTNETHGPDGVKLAHRKAKQVHTYPKIAASDQARQLKLCDRIANVRACWAIAPSNRRSKSLLGMYKDEYGAFRKALHGQGTEQEVKLWAELDWLMAWQP